MFGFSRRRFSGHEKTGRKTSFKPRCEALESRALMSAATVAAPITLTSQMQSVSYTPPPPTAAGLALINGLPDALVRSVALADYQRDGCVTRNHMIDIFFRGTTGFTDLTTSELTSLKTLVSNGTTVAMPNYVQNLGFKSLYGVPAGGLAPAQTLQQNVNNFFLGQKNPNDPGVSYQYFSFPLWNISGPSYKDVSESSSASDGNGVEFAGKFNWLLTGLKEVADRNTTDIMSMFIDNGDGTFTVRFYHGSTPDYVTVDRYVEDLPVYGQVMWPALFLKAYAEENAAGWLGAPKPGVDSYGALMDAEAYPDRDGSNPGSGDPSWAFSAITGLSTTSIGTVDPNAIAAAWSQGHDVVLHTTNDYFSNGLLKTDRAGSLLSPRGWYALVGVSTDGWYSVAPQVWNEYGADATILVQASVLAANFNSWVQTNVSATPLAQINSGSGAVSSAPQTVAFASPASANAQPAAVAPTQIQPNTQQSTVSGAAPLAKAQDASAVSTSLSVAKKGSGVTLLTIPDASIVDIFSSLGMG